MVFKGIISVFFSHVKTPLLFSPSAFVKNIEYLINNPVKAKPPYTILFHWINRKKWEKA